MLNPNAAHIFEGKVSISMYEKILLCSCIGCSNYVGHIEVIISSRETDFKVKTYNSNQIPRGFHKLRIFKSANINTAKIENHLYYF